MQAVVRFEGKSIPVLNLSFNETIERDRLWYAHEYRLRPAKHTVTLTAKLEDGSFDAFVETLGHWPDSFDARLTVGAEVHVDRVCRGSVVLDGIVVSWDLVQGPRMADGRWSPRECAP